MEMETLRGICGFLLVIAVVWLLRTTTSSYRCCCCCCRVCDCIAHWFEPVLRFWPLHLTSSCCSPFFIASFFIIFIIHRPLIVLSLGCYLGLLFIFYFTSLVLLRGYNETIRLWGESSWNGPVLSASGSATSSDSFCHTRYYLCSVSRVVASLCHRELRFYLIVSCRRKPWIRLIVVVIIIYEVMRMAVLCPMPPQV